ncbi:hypothetical protein AAFF_G00299880 [Aldrovandia affinis]|uniref:Small monomeric GTPase n=1 Tax=Aldrovandia affinis TaxID=143900 RepID=A0AAD7W175_9TELE|nr:hypothetical protein AAFF_G00299880 [Aldrovandia affinis]
MEVKRAEQDNLSVEASTEAPCSGACAYSGGQRPVCAGSSKVFLEYKNASQHLTASGVKVSTISKAGMGILKMATSHWRLQEKKALVVRSSSTGNRHPASDRFPCKRSPLDQLAALVLHGHAATCSSPQVQEPGREKMCPTKPQNCRRVVVLGAPRVGKTSILRRFLRDGFEEQYQPTSEDFHRKLYQIRGQTYQIDILDASGERAFPAKRRLSILTGDVFLLVFSVDDRGSFEELRALRQEIITAKSKLLKRKENACVPIVICANKVDLEPQERAISRAEVCQALGEDCPFFETSAKDSTNLEEMFEALAKQSGLPTETGPSQHRKISIRSYQALRSDRIGGRGARGLTQDIPCGALYPLARRPSFSTDLRKVLGPNSSRKGGKSLEKCQIQ